MTNKIDRKKLVIVYKSGAVQVWKDTDLVQNACKYDQSVSYACTIKQAIRKGLLKIQDNDGRKWTAKEICNYWYGAVDIEQRHPLP